MGPALAYDQAGRLTRYTQPGKTSTTYGYDGDGLRASKSTGATTSKYAWDQSATIPLLLADNSNSYIYGPENLSISRSAPPAPRPTCTTTSSARPG